MDGTLELERSYTPDEIAANRLRVAEFVEANADRHDQEVFIELPPELYGPARASGELLALADVAGHCGTKACLAGWCVLLNTDRGEQLPTDDTVALQAIAVPGLLLRALREPDDLLHAGSFRRVGSVEDVARIQLGLSVFNAEVLFYDTTDETAREAIRWLADNPGESQDELAAYLSDLTGTDRTEDDSDD